MLGVTIPRIYDTVVSITDKIIKTVSVWEHIFRKKTLVVHGLEIFLNTEKVFSKIKRHADRKEEFCIDDEQQELLKFRKYDASTRKKINTNYITN